MLSQGLVPTLPNTNECTYMAILGTSYFNKQTYENFDLHFLIILSGFLFVVHGMVKARQDRTDNVILMAENRI